MFKKLFTVLVLLLLAASYSFAQTWDYVDAWPDTNYKGGTHGIAVDPDGNVWQASYYYSTWVTPGGDTLTDATPIFVFSSDGTPLDTIGIIVTGEGFNMVIDTLKTSRCRGLEADADGNIIYVQSGPSRGYKIDYMTREGMFAHDLTETGSSPTGPGTSDDGTIYIGPVVGNGSVDAKIAMYDTEFNYLGDAVVAPRDIARTMEVSADANTIYWTIFTGSKGIDIYTRPDEFSDYALVDSALLGMSIETAAFDPVSGNLWVSNDDRGDSIYSHLTWYEYSVTTEALSDSFTLPLVNAPGTDQLPRGLDFSPDGQAVYVGLFGTAYDRIYKFDRLTGVAQEFGVFPEEYALMQNYPNPFNPTTNIQFNIAEVGNVTLKIYDILGKEVATLVNEEMSKGKYTVQFDASKLASGTYVYELRAGNNVLTNKMMFVK